MSASSAPRRRAPVCAALVVAALLSGCGSGDPAVERWAKQLASGNPEQRTQAVAELAQLTAPDVVEPLMTAARGDARAGIRTAALRALGRPGIGTDPLALAAFLADRETEVAVVAAEALAALGDARAIALLAERLTNREAPELVRAAAVQALSRFGEAGIATLAPVFTCGAGDAPLTIAAVYGRSGDRRYVEPLIAALGAADVRLRRAAAEALAQLGDDRAVAPLAALARAPGAGATTKADAVLAQTRAGAIAALARLGSPAALDALLALLADADAALAGAVAPVVTDADAATRTRIAAVVGDAQRPAAVRIRLLALLAGGAPTAPADAGRGALLKALANDGAADSDEPAEAPPLPEAIRPLVFAGLADADPAFRLHCAERVARVGDVAAVPALVALSDDATHRAAAIAALGRNADARAADRLLALLADASAAPVQGAVIRALAQLGERRAVPALTTIALEGGGDRIAAITALGALGDAALGARLLPLMVANPAKGSPEAARNRAVLDACAELRVGEAVPLLIARLERGEDDENTMRLLGRLGDARAVPAIVRRIGAKPYRFKRLVNFTVRAGGDALVAIGDARAVPAFVALFRTPPDEFCRPYAAQALARLPHDDGAAALVALLTDATVDSTVVESVVAPAIVSAGARAVPPLVRLLTTAPAVAAGANDPGMYAAQLLGTQGAPAATALSVHIEGAARHVQGRLCEALERIADPAAVAALERIAGDAAAEVRTWAVLALGRNRHAEARAALARIGARETDPEVRKWITP